MLASVEFVKANTEERFWRKVNFGREEECWEWLGCIGKGYGKFRYNEGQSAHRYVLSRLLPTFNNELCVLHICDNPGCVNPNHLFQGTQGDNVRDAENKGRAKHPKGKSNGKTKLTENQVIQIKELLKNNIPYRGIAKKFSVSKSAIGCIKTGITHKFL